MIDFFNASAGAGQTVNVAGHVADYDPNAGALSVSLSGPLQATVTPDAAGNFSYAGAASSLGALEAVAADAGTGLSSAPAQTAIANAAPQIAFSVTETGVGQNVVLSGTVQDEWPAGLTVNFSGVVSGSVTTDSAGNFSFATTASALGTVMATTSDVWGVSSPATDATLTNCGPTVNLWCSASTSDQPVTVYGQVADGVPGNQTVTITGAVSGTVTTDAYGNFSLTAIASGPGTVSATAANAWGQTSAAATTTFSPYASSTSTSTTTTTSTTTDTTAPTIGDLMAVVVAGPDANGNYTWELTGTITDEPGTYTLTLSGLVSGSYTVTTTQSDNHFGVQFSLPEGSSGEITVQATDSSGNVSAPVTYWLFSP